MHLLLRTSLLIIVLFVVGNSFAQKDSVRYVHSPYRNEYTPHFKLGVFKRGFSTDSLTMALDSLETKPRTLWSRLDSLNFARISLEIGNRELSEYYFDNLKVNLKTEEFYWYDHLMIHYLNTEYEEGLDEIREESPMILEFTKMYFFKKILEAKLKQSKDPKWYKTHSVFNWEVDSTLNSLDKKSPEFQNGVIKPLRNLEFVLKRIITFVYEEDEIVASACREMGHIIEGHLSLSQAYIAYSLGRHYNKRDKDLLADLKAIKGRISEKKYKIPNFRKYFPRTEEWRFEYNVLKERIIFAKNDTNQYVKPATMKPKPEPLISFPQQFIVLGGLLFMILLLAFILKTKKKK